MSALDSTSTIMFSVVFVMSFVFSILGLIEFASSIDRKKASFLSLVSCLIAAIVWFAFSLIWTASATMAMYVAFGYLWMVLGFVFTVLTIASAFLILRYSAKPEERGALEIRERTL